MYELYKENDEFQCFLAKSIFRTSRSNFDLWDPDISVLISMVRYIQ